MRVLARPLRLLVLAGALWLFVLGTGGALADTGNIIEPQHEPATAADGWQAGTCTTDTPKCSPATPEQFYRQAAGHPPVSFTQYTIQHEPFTPLSSPPFPPGSLQAEIKPPLDDRSIKTLRVDLPPGLTVNPEAAPRCSLADFEREVEVAGEEKIVPACEEAEQVGVEEVTLVTNAPGVEVPGVGVIPIAGFVIQPTPGVSKVPVYNLEPKAGEPALFGFVIAGEEKVFIETEVAWESDYHESLTIRPPNAEVPGLSTLNSRLVNVGTTTGDGTFINNPTTCFNPNEPGNARLYSTWFRAESYGEENPSFPFGSTAFEAGLPEEEGKIIEQEGCGEVPFEPSLDIAPGTSKVDSPAGLTVTTKLDYLSGEESERQEAHLRKAVVELPEGLGFNPAGATDLRSCTETQFKKGVRTYTNECPEASKIGMAAIESPSLPEGSLKGDIFLRAQKGFDPASGEEFGFLVEAKSEEFGIDIRLVGSISANPITGQLTTTVDEQEVGEFAGKLPSGLPQVPLESIEMHFTQATGGLMSPPTCGPHKTTSMLEPWSTAANTKHPSSEFSLTELPSGGPCPASLGARPFDLAYHAGPAKSGAGEYGPFVFQVSRPDGAQEIRQVNADLSPGMVAKLAGVSYCPEADIAAAEAKSGKAEIAAPSCPSDSLVGAADIVSGSGNGAGGPTPIDVDGKVYLAGPYKGAPISFVVVTPAVAGPFDLGTVVTKVAINIDPETAQVHAISDPVPYVYGGVRLDVREIHVEIDRSDFTLNPTTCRSGLAVASTIFGGGSNPLDPAAWSTVNLSNPYQGTNCKALQFKPKFYARLFGGKKQTRRTQHPKFRAILDARKGDANVRRAAFILPKATILDQGHIKTICTRVQLAAHECPKNAVYGYAKATSPLLDDPLKGPVYLTSSSHELPDLLADLHGQVPVRLRGVISSEHGRLKTVFNETPDVPVNKFELTMKGGDRGLLVNSTSLCSGQMSAYLNLRAQNSRQMKKSLPLNIPGCRSGKKHKR